MDPGRSWSGRPSPVANGSPRLASLSQNSRLSALPLAMRPSASVKQPKKRSPVDVDEILLDVPIDEILEEAWGEDAYEKWGCFATSTILCFVSEWLERVRAAREERKLSLRDIYDAAE